MGLRLFRRDPAAPAAGRHRRGYTGPGVTGAAATLMAPDAWDRSLPVLTSYDDGTPAPVALEVEAPALAETQPVPVVAVPPEPVVAVPEPAPAAHLPSVALGFADGHEVALDPDDPRVRTFRAAAAALLERPQA